MKILVLNGPNLNMLGIREPKIYGKNSFADLLALLDQTAREAGVEVAQYQSNHEGSLVDAIQEAYGKFDGIVINPGAYTHTSVAILDALKAVSIPAVAIGGINEGNIMSLAGSGVSGVAVVSAIFAADDPAGAAASLRSLAERAVARG